MGKAATGIPRLLTIGEAAALAGRLTGRPCSARQVRYLLVQGALGTDPAAVRRGQTRLFGIVDLALLRLALRLQGDGLSAAAARIVLTYLRNDLVHAWKAASAVALAVRGVRGTIEHTAKGRPGWATAWVPLREVWRDLDAEMEHVRLAHPKVWMWRKLPAAHAAAERGRLVLS